MKQFGIAILMLLGLTLIGCGFSNGNSTTNNAKSNWNATLVSGDNVSMFHFKTSLSTDSGGLLTISNFNFTSESACFADGETETGSITQGGDLVASPSGQFGMVIQSNPPSENKLALTGMDSGNTISGNWTLTGSTGCNASGTFTMTKTA